MGYDAIHIADIRGRVSRHNSERDREHDKLAIELHREIMAVVEQPKYKAIGAEDYAGFGIDE